MFNNCTLCFSEQIPSEGRQNQVHPGGGRHLHQTRQEESGAAERREGPP